MHPDWLPPGPSPAAVKTDQRCEIAKRVNDVVTPEASPACARVASGVTTRFHALDGVTERCIIIRGEDLMKADGRSWRVVPGDRVSVAPGLAQCMTKIGTRPLELDCICTPRFVRDAYRDLDA